MKPGFPRKAAILGAGVMGAQIAAHLANAGVEVLLFDLAPLNQDHPNARALDAIAKLHVCQPPPLAAPARAQCITPANYHQHLEKLRGCDLVVESICERIDNKEGLFARIAPYLERRTVITSNTSGLSIERMARALPECMRPYFCGMQFFNPVRYRYLVELIPSSVSDARVLDCLEGFLVTHLGKGVIRAKDTPYFIANRISLFALLAAMHHGERLQLAPDTVDALTSSAFGWPERAIFGVADRIGLDVLADSVAAAREALANDPWVDYLKLPDWLLTLAAQGALGLKSGGGVYRERGEQVWDSVGGGYRRVSFTIKPVMQALFAISEPGERFAALRANSHPQAQFLWSLLRDVLHYCAYWLADIADTARDVDLAMRWGFAWPRGPFELWQSIGWRKLAVWIETDCSESKTLAAAPLAAWVTQLSGVHCPQGSYSAKQAAFKPRSALPVYRRQLLPATLLGEAGGPDGDTVFEDANVRLWRSGELGGIAVLSFKEPQRSINEPLLDSLREALSVAEQDARALILWQGQPPFARELHVKVAATASDKSQHILDRLRFMPIPTVAAVHGEALGYGCRLALSCDRIVTALEGYFGLNDRVSSSAEQAREQGLLRATDVIIFNPYELLHVAKTQAQALLETGYRPPLPALRR